MIPFADLKPANQSIRPLLDEAIRRVFDRGIFLNGPEVSEFEEKWAVYCGAKYCVACANGTDALMLGAHALSTCSNLPENKMWEIPANVCPFTKTALDRGFRYTIADVDERGLPRFSDWHLPVLLYGRYPKKFSSTWCLVDACQAHGWKSYEATACWSFYPTKNLGSFGDAGAVTTEHPNYAISIRSMAQRWHSRMSEVNAAVLLAKLPFLDVWNFQRATIAEVYYNELPTQVEFVTRPGEKTNHHIFAILTDRRDQLKSYLYNQEIAGTAIHYPEPLAVMPGAKRWCSRVLSLPCYPGLTPKQVQTVCDGIRTFFK